VSAIALWETRGLTKVSYAFPRTIAAILLMLSLVYFILSLRRRSNHKGLFPDIEKKKAVAMGIGMIGYTVAIGIFGFLISSMIYIGLFTWYLQKDVDKSNKMKVIHATACSIVFGLSFFLLFKYVFLVPLPTGLFAQL
jgi:phosphoglycerol transferase MdoB-like AlkP superfamily enzyme